jgi:hypothetical protein
VTAGTCSGRCIGISAFESAVPDSKSSLSTLYFMQCSDWPSSGGSVGTAAAGAVPGAFHLPLAPPVLTACDTHSTAAQRRRALSAHPACLAAGDVVQQLPSLAPSPLRPGSPAVALSTLAFCPFAPTPWAGAVPEQPEVDPDAFVDGHGLLALTAPQRASSPRQASPPRLARAGSSTIRSCCSRAEQPGSTRYTPAIAAQLPSLEASSRHSNGHSNCDSTRLYVSRLWEVSEVRFAAAAQARRRCRWPR